MVRKKGSASTLACPLKKVGPNHLELRHPSLGGAIHRLFKTYASQKREGGILLLRRVGVVVGGWGGDLRGGLD